MELNVQINPDDINKMVSEAVLKSAIGEELKKAIAKQMEQLGRTFDNPVEHVVNQHVRDMVQGVLIGTYTERIRERIHQAVAAKITDEFIGKVIENGLRNW